MVQRISPEKLREISIEVAEVHSQHLRAWSKLVDQAVEFAALIYELAEVTPPSPPATWAWNSRGIPSRLIEAVGDARTRMLQPQQGGPERVGDELKAVAVILSGAAKFRPEMSSMERLTTMVRAFADQGPSAPSEKLLNTLSEIPVVDSIRKTALQVAGDIAEIVSVKMDLNDAIDAMKKGGVVSRRSWPGGGHRMSIRICQHGGGQKFIMNVTSTGPNNIPVREDAEWAPRPEDSAADDWFIVDRPVDDMSFGDALDAIKRGELVSLRSWPWKDLGGMCIGGCIVDGKPQLFEVRLRMPDSDKRVKWFPTWEEMYAEDWFVPSLDPDGLYSLED